jgi:predicted transposase YdaD
MLNLGPRQPATLGRFLTEDVAWVDLEALCRQQGTDPLLALLTIPLDDLRHTRAFQEILSEGRQEGQRQEASALTLRLLERRCGPLLPATRAAIEALELPQLETLAEELLDFSGTADLLRWLELQG